MSWFRNIISGAAGLVFVVGLPAVMIFNGAKETLEDNPVNADDRLSAESYKYDGKQFLEGATFGIYDADEGVTSDGVGDVLYDAGKSTLQFGTDTAKRIFDRASEDLEGVELPAVNSNSNSTKPEDCKHPDYARLAPECW